jgi:two-component system, OmpR family, alkaline phosphatase synthesis response regulator PhoP
MTKILIVEDHLLTARLVEFKLSRVGFLVTVVANGADAVKLANDQGPSLIILDSLLPLEGGFEVLQNIRDKPSCSLIPVIMLLAKDRKKDVSLFKKLGVTDFLQKPFDPDDLMERVLKILPAPSKEAVRRSTLKKSTSRLVKKI